MNVRMKKIKSQIEVPGDKSISHRALMIASISKGVSSIENFLFSHDSLSTMSCLRDLGVRIDVLDNRVRVYGNGLHSFKKYDGVLDARNSGTTIRLLSGILSGSDFSSVITGDDSLRRRPMDRIIKPLSLMGANIFSLSDNKYAPLYINGCELSAINYNMEVDSAQVKSCILFAGLHCNEESVIYENIKTRDHTERMLKYFNANINIDDKRISIRSGELQGRNISIPGDISSASFFMVLASCIQGSELIVRNVGVNHTRTGIVDVLIKMGVNVEFLNRRYNYFEEVCDIKVSGCCKLKGVLIEGDIIPRLIDEIPIICVLAAFSKGETIIKGIDELRYKESNRVKSIVDEFTKLGIEICEFDEGIKIVGGNPIKGCEVDSHNDHRIAMSLMILSCISGEDISIRNMECVDISFPGFYDVLREVIK